MGEVFDYENLEERIKDKEKEKERKQRLAKMKQEKELQILHRKIIKKYGPYAAIAVVVVILIVLLVVNLNSGKNENDTTLSMPVEESTVEEVEEIESSVCERIDEPVQTTQEEIGPLYSAQTTSDTVNTSEEILSKYAIFIDKSTGNILSARDYQERINPASMTKILTVLVAAENVTNLDDKFTITIDITDYSFAHGCSNVGWSVNETVTVRDLFYGTILSSGADAAVGLATYVAGSHEAFVELMNKKLEELGLSQTSHFTNCVGLYDENHYCTAYDMAMILEAALDNEFCREVLSTHVYTTSETEQHPEGLIISNWFLRRIEDKDTGGEVICAKTGYVVQSRSCAASYGKDKAGNEYICVTAGAEGSWKCIYDHVALYSQFAKE